MARFSESLEAYREALKTIEDDRKMTPTALSLKRQCESDMKEVERKLASPPDLLYGSQALTEQMPWKRVWNMREQIYAAPTNPPPGVRPGEVVHSFAILNIWFQAWSILQAYAVRSTSQNIYL